MSSYITCRALVQPAQTSTCQHAPASTGLQTSSFTDVRIQSHPHEVTANHKDLQLDPLCLRPAVHAGAHVSQPFQ